MCKFENKTKKCCAKFIYWISMALIVVGLVAGIVGIAGPAIQDTWEIGDKKYPSPTAVGAALALVAGLLACITGVMGLLTARCKNCCFTMPFMLLCLIVSILMLVAAAVCLALSSQKDAIMAAICTGEGQEPIKIGDQSFKSLDDFFKQYYGTSVDKYMCSYFCPCDEQFKEKFETKLAEPHQFSWKVEGATEDQHKVSSTYKFVSTDARPEFNAIAAAKGAGIAVGGLGTGGAAGGSGAGGATGGSGAGGSGGAAGGWSAGIIIEKSGNIWKKFLADGITKDIMAKKGSIKMVDETELEPQTYQKQVVAGTNYKVTYWLSDKKQGNENSLIEVQLFEDLKGVTTVKSVKDVTSDLMTPPTLENWSAAVDIKKDDAKWGKFTSNELLRSIGSSKGDLNIADYSELEPTKYQQQANGGIQYKVTYYLSSKKTGNDEMNIEVLYMKRKFGVSSVTRIDSKRRQLAKVPQALVEKWKLDRWSKISLTWGKPDAEKKISGQVAYESFTECYNGFMKAWFEKEAKEQSEMVDKAVVFFGGLEKNMKCSGACTMPLFGIQRKLSEGPVEKDCVTEIADSLGTLTGPGVVCLLTWFILVAAFFGSIPLCYGFNDIEDGAEGSDGGWLCGLCQDDKPQQKNQNQAQGDFTNVQQA